MTLLKYGSLTIGNINNSSGIFIGTNLQKGRQSKLTIQEGFGTIRGIKNNVQSNTGVVKKDLKKE